MNWYLIQNKPNAHFIAAKHLKNQNYEVFLPLTQKTLRSNRKFVTNMSPLFPGYLFIRSDPRNISWKSIKATRGVSKVVTLDGQYRPVNSAIIDHLKEKCGVNDVVNLTDNLKSGDQVRIENGPLSNFICNVERIDKHQRVWVLLDLMRQKTTVQVLLKDVCKIPNSF